MQVKVLDQCFQLFIPPPPPGQDTAIWSVCFVCDSHAIEASITPSYQVIAFHDCTREERV